MNDFPILPLVTTLACLLALYFYVRTRQLIRALLYTARVLLNMQRTLHAVLTDETAYVKGKARIRQIEELNKELEKVVTQ